MDAFLIWAKRQVDDWTRSLVLLKSGVMFTGENMREGRVDTTAQTIIDVETRLADLEALIAKQEGRNA